MKCYINIKSALEKIFYNNIRYGFIQINYLKERKKLNFQGFSFASLYSMSKSDYFTSYWPIGTQYYKTYIA